MNTEDQTAQPSPSSPEPLPVHVMLDLETMGTRAGCAITAIGAVRFDAEGRRAEFYQTIDLRSCERAGLRIEADTALWWLRQGESARRELFNATTHLNDALLQFSAWMQEGGAETCVWGNGADFDNVILTAAYERVQIYRPWPRFRDRCFRTVKNLFPAPLLRAETAHHALLDAQLQAQFLIDLLRPSGALLRPHSSRPPEPWLRTESAAVTGLPVTENHGP